jgi:hypothetical protein
MLLEFQEIHNVDKIIHSWNKSYIEAPNNWEGASLF